MLSEQQGADDDTGADRQPDRGAREAEKAGDFVAAVRMYTDDIEHDVVGAPGGPLLGPEAAARRYERMQRDMEQDELVEKDSEDEGS